MAVNIIDGNLARKMILAGAEALSRDREAIDALNVFPVPDGDTGTNMSLTMFAAAREVEKLAEGAAAGEVLKAAAHGSLRGARGNSGVILSQLLRGFSKELENNITISVRESAPAFLRATETAYKAVMKPKEGTILTVARALADAAAEVSAKKPDVDFEDFGRVILAHGEAVLKKTPDMLPVLKQAKVVDAGGKGLLCIIRAAALCLGDGEAVAGLSFGFPEEIIGGETAGYSSLAEVDGDIRFAYCTEFFINFDRNQDYQRIEADMKIFLDELGDSVVAVSDEEMMKVHVHTNAPGAVLEKALTYGFLSNIKIDNMRLQHDEKVSFLPELEEEEPAELKEAGFIAVSSGLGFKNIFESIGVDFVIEGGQTMNPSAEDFISAASKVNASNIFVFPNNSNVILAARQAAELAEGKNIFVIPTKTVPQGINALLAFSHGVSPEDNAGIMTGAAGDVITGQVTFAVRDSMLDGHEIAEGDVICVVDGKISHVAKTLEEGAKAVIDSVAGSADVVTLFYGDGADKAGAEALFAYVGEAYPDVEAELQYGGQAVYPYVISAL